MAQDRAGVRAGFLVPGVYAHFLDRERARCYRDDPRLFLVEDAAERVRLVEDARAAGVPPVSRTERLDRLEAGVPVAVQRWELGRGAVGVDVPLLADRTVRWFQVTADDVVSPCAAPHLTRP